MPGGNDIIVVVARDIDIDVGDCNESTEAYH